MPQRPKIADNILELIGYTPLVRLHRIPHPNSAELICKLESQNPMDSVKDRIGVAMIDAAEREGRIKAGETVLIEPTSGNTGIGLALVATIKGYKLIVTMPETVTVERRRVLVALGAEVVLTPGDEGMKGAIKSRSSFAQRLPIVGRPGNLRIRPTQRFIDARRRKKFLRIRTEKSTPSSPGWGRAERSAASVVS